MLAVALNFKIACKDLGTSVICVLESDEEKLLHAGYIIKRDPMIDSISCPCYMHVVPDWLYLVT